MSFAKFLVPAAASLSLLSAAAGVPDVGPASAPVIREWHEILNLDSLAGVRPRVKGESVQGIAVCDGTLFALYHGGDCVVASLDEGAFVSEFQIEAAAGTHCNNASFGVERASSESEFPLLYVSECNAPSRCFVVDISRSGASPVSTVRFAGSGIVDFCDWCVDRENRHLYAYGKTPEGGAVLKRFALPALADMTAAGGELVLYDEDVLCEYIYPNGCFRIPQGSCICGGMIYLPTGVPSAGSRYIHIVDLSNGERVLQHCIDDIPLEPEGAFADREHLLVMFGSRGSSGRLMSFGLRAENENVAE